MSGAPARSLWNTVLALMVEMGSQDTFFVLRGARNSVLGGI